MNTDLSILEIDGLEYSMPDVTHQQRLKLTTRSEWRNGKFNVGVLPQSWRFDLILINISGEDSQGQQRTGTIARHHVESLICLYHRKPEDTTEGMTAKVVEFDIALQSQIGEDGRHLFN